MAEEIRLVGVFTDDITPKLKKLSKSINDVAKSFTKIQTKLRPIVKEMGMLAMASDRVATALKAQKSAIDANSRSWSNYKKEVGQAAGAQRKAFKGVPRGGTPAPSIPRARTPRVARSRPMAVGGGGANAAAVGGGVFGVGLSNTLTTAIVSGFRIGTSMMLKPFQYFGAALAERIGDEMADIQSAGGMFAVDQKSKEGDRIFKNFNQARAMQEDLNRQLAKSAAALPGATNDYVVAARGVTDTIMQAFQSDREEFAKVAQSLGVSKDASAEEQISKVLSKFTEQTVLLGQGGAKGGMPLTMLMEQLVTSENIQIASLRNKYRATLGRNALLSNALQDSEEEINATQAGSAKRVAATMKAMQKALPEEVITAMRMSAAGVIESVRSGFMDPDTGLFGLGRELELAIPKVNEYGQFVKENGDVVGSASEAFKENTTLFKIIRETLGGFLTPLSSLVEFLPSLFDPLLGIGEAFVELRETSMLVLQKFNAYSNWFKSQEFPDAPQRGALAAFNKLLESIGAIDKQEALSTAQLLETKGSDLGSIAKNVLTKLFDSDFMKQIGEALGKAIGSVFSAMAKVLGGANDMASAGPFAEGFQKGFKSVKGGEAIKTIIQSVFALLGKAILEIFKAAPFETSLVTGLVLFGPAIAAAIGTAILGAIPRMLSGSMLAKAAVDGGATSLSMNQSYLRGAPKSGGGPFVSASGAKLAGRIGNAGKGLLGGLKSSKAVSSFAKAAKNMASVAKPLTKFAKAIPGGAVAIGAIDAGLRIASGESAGKAIGGAVASTVGATLGGILGQALIPIPGVGAALGAVAGGFLGDAVFSAMMPNSEKQEIAAQTQLEAARLQANIAREKGAGATGVDVGGASALVQDPMKLNNVLNSLGLGADKTAQALIDSSSAVRFQQERYNDLNDALFAQTQKLKALDFSPAQIAANTGVKELTGQLETQRTKLRGVQEKLSQDFAKIPSKVQEQIVDRVKNWTPTQIEGAITAMINAAANKVIAGIEVKPVMGGVSTNFPGFGPITGPVPTGPTPSTIFSPPSLYDNLQFRAKGGPVTSGSQYMVGERGPELFLPNQSGKIIPNQDLGGGGNTFNINVSGGGSAQETAEIVAQQIVYAIQKSTYNELYTS